MLMLLRRFFDRRSVVRPHTTAGSAGEHESVSGKAEAAYREARILIEGGNLDRALELLREATKLKHDLAAAHYWAGIVHERRDELEDSRDCYQLAVHFDPHFVPGQLGLSRVLVLTGLGDQAVEALNRALSFIADSAELHFALASTLKSQGDFAGAAEHYQHGLGCDPGSAAAHCNFCYVLNELGRYDEARRHGEAALALDPGLAAARHNLGLALLAQGQPADAAQHLLRARSAQPGIPEVAAALGHAYRDLGRFDDALDAYDAALRLAPDFGDAISNRAYLLLMQGDFERGWNEYEQRYAATGTAERDFSLPRWNGEKLAGKTVLVYAEQGIGDEVMFASCLPDLIETAGHVVVDCSTRLEGLFRRSFSQAQVHGGGKNDPVDWLAEVGTADFQVPIGSLPRFFRRTRNAFPRHAGYLHADAGCVRRWKRRLDGFGNGFRIGLSWRGGTHKTRGQLRSVPLSRLKPILDLTNAVFVSLQHFAPEEESIELNSRLDGAIHVFPGVTEDIEELAGLMTALDLIVSVDNTNVHLAGALGRPVWVLLPHSPEWRYLRSGAEMPWYPSARLFRQPEPGDWGSVLSAVASALTGHRQGSS